MSKFCPQCGNVKESQEFYADKRSPLGISSTCKACDTKRCHMKTRQGPKQQSFIERERLEEINTRIRRCHSCQERKELCEFYKDSTKFNGHDTNCKMCHSAECSLQYRINLETRLKYQLDYRSKNVEQTKASIRRWRKENPEKVQWHASKRRALVNAAEGSFTPNEWKALVDKCESVCLHCQKKAKMTVDHIIPLSKGGTNYISNIQPLCKSCNSKKKDKVLNDISLGLATQSV